MIKCGDDGLILFTLIRFCGGGKGRRRRRKGGDEERRGGYCGGMMMCGCGIVVGGCVCDSSGCDGVVLGQYKGD